MVAGSVGVIADGYIDIFIILVKYLIVTRSTVAIAGGKAQQFTILNVDTIFDFYKPKPPLSNFVDNFWLYEGHETEHKIERILPTGTPNW